MTTMVSVTRKDMGVYYNPLYSMKKEETKIQKHKLVI